MSLTFGFRSAPAAAAVAQLSRCSRGATAVSRAAAMTSRLRLSAPGAMGAFSPNPLLFSHRLMSSRQPPKILPEEEKFIVRSPYSDVEVPEINLCDYVLKDVDKWPNNVALVRRKFLHLQ